MHKLHTIFGHRARYHRFLTFASPAVVAVLMAVAPRLALAAEHKLCVRWRVDAIDRSAGTLRETAALAWPARGVRLRVTDAGGAIIADGRANTTDGCFTYQDVGVPGQTTFRNVRVYYDTRVGTPSDGETVGRVQVRGFFDSTQVTNNTDVSILFQSVGFSSFPDNTYQSTLTVGSGADPMSISMASVSHTLHRVDTAMTSNKPAAPPVLKVILKKCQFVNNWSCIDVLNGRLYLISDAEDPENGSTRRKFVSGHEAGHWLDYYWGGEQFASFASSAGANYSYSGGAPQVNLAPPCRFTWASIGMGGQGSSAHAMRSQEYQRGAVLEAFAHFMALYAYNEASATKDPVFQYYKKEIASDIDASYPAEDRYFGAYETTSSLIAVPSAYLQSPMGCNCTALGNCHGTSTQMQWMRALWWYLLRDEPGGLKPTLDELFGQLQSTVKSGVGIACGPTVDRCYGAVSAAVPGFLARWQWVGSQMGLASDTP